MDEDRISVGNYICDVWAGLRATTRMLPEYVIIMLEPTNHMRRCELQEFIPPGEDTEGLAKKFSIVNSATNRPSSFFFDKQLACALDLQGLIDILQSWSTLSNST